MKKLSILLLAVLALIACGKTYSPQVVELTSQNDSLNYAFGLVNGAQIKMYMQADSSDEAIAEIIDAIERKYNGEDEDESEATLIGKNSGIAIKNMESTGLYGKATIALNEELLFQGLVNGAYMDTTVMSIETAHAYFMNTISTIHPNADAPVAKAITAKCGTEVKTVELFNQEDSLNYALGLLVGGQEAIVFATDSTGVEFKEYVDAINKGLKSSIRNPQLVMEAEQLGEWLKSQEPTGLFGEARIVVNFELFKQGCINGMYQFNDIFDSKFAMNYVDSVVTAIKFGPNLKEGELFLKEVAKNDSVQTTESGLMYKIIKLGKGEKPAATDTVTVDYTGKFTNGEEFDSSYGRGVPATFSLSNVIPAWTEGLQLMPVGSKFELYVPYQLGYGEKGMPNMYSPTYAIPPYSTLVFEIELLKVTKAVKK